MKNWEETDQLTINSTIELCGDFSELFIRSN